MFGGNYYAAMSNEAENERIKHYEKLTKKAIKAGQNKDELTLVEALELAIVLWQGDYPIGSSIGPWSDVETGLEKTLWKHTKGE